MLAQTAETPKFAPGIPWVRVNMDPCYGVKSSGRYYGVFATLAEAAAAADGYWHQGYWVSDEIKIFHPGELNLDPEMDIRETDDIRAFPEPIGRERLFPNHTGIFWSERIFLD